MGNREFMEGILTNEAIDVVMHFAAFAYVGESVADPLKYYDKNVAKTIRLLEAMQATGVNKFIFSSSCTIFGDTDEMPLSEDRPRNAFSPYGQTKQDVEVMLGYCAKAYGLLLLPVLQALEQTQKETLEDLIETHLIPLAVQATMNRQDKLTVSQTTRLRMEPACVTMYTSTT